MVDRIPLVTRDEFEALQMTPGPRGLRGLTGPQGEVGEGLVILGELASEAELPAGLTVTDAGDAYLIGGNLFVWDGAVWNNVGAVRGPEGPAGSDADVTAHEAATDPHPQYDDSDSITTAVSAHDTGGPTSHIDKPVMWVAISDGVFVDVGNVDIYVVPNASWSLPSLTGLPDGTLIFRVEP